MNLEGVRYLPEDSEKEGRRNDVNRASYMRFSKANFKRLYFSGLTDGQERASVSGQLSAKEIHLHNKQLNEEVISYVMTLLPSFSTLKPYSYSITIITFYGSSPNKYRSE